MKFELSVLEVGIICTDLAVARANDECSLRDLDHERFPNMGRILTNSINKKTDLINRLDLLVNPRKEQSNE